MEVFMDYDDVRKNLSIYLKKLKNNGVDVTKIGKLDYSEDEFDSNEDIKRFEQRKPLYDWSAFTKREHQIIINTLDNLDDKNGEEAIVKDLILRTMDAPFYRDKAYVHQVNKFDIYRAVRTFDLYGDKQHYLFAEAYDNLKEYVYSSGIYYQKEIIEENDIPSSMITYLRALETDTSPQKDLYNEKSEEHMVEPTKKTLLGNLKSCNCIKTSTEETPKRTLLGNMDHLSDDEIFEAVETFWQQEAKSNKSQK